MLFACSIEVPKVEYKIPENLKNNKEAISIMKDMSEAVHTFHGSSHQIMKDIIDDCKANEEPLPSGKDIDNKMSASQKISVLFGHARFEFSTYLIKRRAKLLQENLNAEQTSELYSELQQIRKEKGKLNHKILRISAEELAKLDLEYEYDEKSIIDEYNENADDLPPLWLMIFLMTIAAIIAIAIFVIPVWVIIKLLRKFINHKDEL